MQVRFVVRAQNHRITQISQCKGRKNMILHHSQQAFFFFGVLRYYKAEGMGHARWKGGECKTCEVAGSCSGKQSQPRRRVMRELGGQLVWSRKAWSTSWGLGALFPSSWRCSLFQPKASRCENHRRLFRCMLMWSARGREGWMCCYHSYTYHAVKTADPRI